MGININRWGLFSPKELLQQVLDWDLMTGGKTPQQQQVIDVLLLLLHIQMDRIAALLRPQDTYCGLAPALNRIWMHSRLPDWAALWMGASPTKSWRHNTGSWWRLWHVETCQHIKRRRILVTGQQGCQPPVCSLSHFSILRLLFPFFNLMSFGAILDRFYWPSTTSKTSAVCSGDYRTSCWGQSGVSIPLPVVHRPIQWVIRPKCLSSDPLNEHDNLWYLFSAKINIGQRV